MGLLIGVGVAVASVVMACVLCVLSVKRGLPPRRRPTRDDDLDGEVKPNDP